jgi:hypothetical protein
MASLLLSAEGDRDVLGDLLILLYYLTTKSGLWTLMVHSITYQYNSRKNLQMYGKFMNIVFKPPQHAITT